MTLRGRLPLRSHWLVQWHTSQVLGGRLEHQSFWRRVLGIVAFRNESFVESRPNPSSIAVVAIDRFARDARRTAAGRRSCHFAQQALQVVRKRLRPGTPRRKDRRLSSLLSLVVGVADRLGLSSAT